jgi:hypothetical protein
MDGDGGGGGGGGGAAWDLHAVHSAGGGAGLLSGMVTLIVRCFPSSVWISRMASIMSISQSLGCRNEYQDSSAEKIDDITIVTTSFKTNITQFNMLTPVT